MRRQILERARDARSLSGPGHGAPDEPAEVALETPDGGAHGEHQQDDGAGGGDPRCHLCRDGRIRTGTDPWAAQDDRAETSRAQGEHAYRWSGVHDPYVEVPEYPLEERCGERIQRQQGRHDEHRAGEALTHPIPPEKEDERRGGAGEEYRQIETGDELHRVDRPHSPAELEHALHIVQGLEVMRVVNFFTGRELFAVYQRREFDRRPAGEDVDDYLRVGLRLEREIGKVWTLNMQYAYAIYGEPGGDEDSTHRVAAYFTGRFGRAAVSRTQPLLESARPAETNAIIRDDDVLFRIRAPGADLVSVIGDFNGWDPERHPMREAGNGWWEIALPVGPGARQYAFVIDGEIVTPPMAESTVEDGFGGRNGLLGIPE